MAHKQKRYKLKISDSEDFNLFFLLSGKPYGNYKMPLLPGSGGGGGYGGFGGGTIILNISKILHCDGIISSQGGNSTGFHSGGGSGGSVYTQTSNFSGHGILSVEGGSAKKLGGGGSGGRIGVNVTERWEFSGIYRAYGGYGSGNKAENGAAGTVYHIGHLEGSQRNNSSNYIFSPYSTRLYLDNDNRNHKLPTIISGMSKYYEFDELVAWNHVLLWIDGHDKILIVHKFRGDRTGLLHVRDQQKIFVEYVSSEPGYTVAPVSYQIDAGTEIIFSSTVILLGTRTTVAGLMTGIQNLTLAEGATARFQSTAQTALLENKVYFQKTKPGNVSITRLTIQRGSVAEFNETKNNLSLTISNFVIKYNGKAFVNSATFYTDETSIESKGILQVSFTEKMGFGRGQTVGNIGYGAAHGGHGGAPKQHTGGNPYDSVYQPLHPGSVGGNGLGTGGRGGGYLHWINGKNFWLDGEIMLPGESGTGMNGGGGSGGAIVLETLNMTGVGTINCRGGNASITGRAGGGGGGRIAILMGFANKFSGFLKVTGGFGSRGIPSGAAGTVYREETNRGPMYADIKYDKSLNKTFNIATHKRLEVNNDNIDSHLYTNHAIPWLYTVIKEGGQDVYEFDELVMSGHSNLKLAYPDNKNHVNVSIHKFLGDRTGLFHLKRNQKLFVEVQESVTNETYAQCSFLIDPGSEAVFPETLNLLGTRTYLAGRLTNAQHFVIRAYADVLFQSTAQTALIENGNYTLITPLGNFSFATFNVARYGMAQFQQIKHSLGITAAEFIVKYQGILFMNQAEIFSTYAHVESQGVFHLDGAGYPGQQGPGAGARLKNGVGTGAGYGGYGGGPGPRYGGQAYGSYFIPILFGSGGGNSSLAAGGSGGGILIWNSGEVLELNGRLSSLGADGQGVNAGGGSGGSIFITATNMSGHGVIAVAGGRGVNLGSGGAGGRVAIHCRWRYQYGGRFDNYGGYGGAAEARMHAGAAGTTYVEENYRELEYRLKKYDKTLNTTFLAVDHIYLHSDNKLIYSPAATLLVDSSKVFHEFNELELTGSSRLQIYHPNNATRVEMVVHKFIGDKTGQLHLRRAQKAYVEVVEAVLNRTEAPCSFIIDEKSEIILPGLVYIHGTNSSVSGTVTGVQDLYVDSQALIVFWSSANTAQLENGTYTQVTKPGHFRFDTVTVKRGGFLDFLRFLELLSIECSEIRVKYEGTLLMDHAEIYSTYSWIESRGVFHLNGGGHEAGRGPGAGVTISNTGYGASHGGMGGGANVNKVADAYGSVFAARQKGSGGGSSTAGVGGRGGGALTWSTSHYMELNGELNLKGMDAAGNNAGGGSGGSLWIKTTNFTGHGIISVRGGDGKGMGGGGAGGRISIHCRWRYSYGGKYINRGGLGYGSFKLSHAAAAGTSFVENNLRPLEYRILKYLKGTNETYFQVDYRYVHSDNQGYFVPGATVVMENMTMDYEFDEMEIAGFSRVLVYHPQNLGKVTLIVHRLTGDRTGQFHLRRDQIAYIEYVESERNMTEAPCGYVIDDDAEVVFPTEVYMQGVNTTLAGLLSGIHHIYIEDGCVFTTLLTSQTAQIENGTYVEYSGKGNFSLPTINVRSDGVLEFREILKDLTITAGFMEIKYKGTVLMNNGYIVAGDLDLETNALIDLNGRGWPNGQGPGAGQGNSGASYGGQAGRKYNSVFNTKFCSLITIKGGLKLL